MRLLTEKQTKVLSTVDRFGIISSSQLIVWLEGDMSHVTVYSTKNKLLQLGLIDERKIGRQLVIYIKPSGVDYLGSTLTSFTKLNLTTLQHQLIMNECIIRLRKLVESKGQTFTFLSERELRSDYLDQNFDRKQRQNTTLLKKVADRIPDFVTFDADGHIAHEVELTRKSSKRYYEKMSRYKDEILNDRYKQVRYLCENDRIREAVTEQAQKAAVPGHMLQIESIGRLLTLGENE